MKEMRAVYQAIEDNYEMAQTILTQDGDRRPTEVFDEFMRTDNSALFGSKSFFEGIDVQGEKLRLVILTKLPFPQWGDPIVQAKKQQLGDEYFSRYYLPRMFTELQQAAGRLIRTKDDRGVFAVLDVRVWVGSSKTANPQKAKMAMGYGNRALKQLPFTNRTSDFALVDKFLKHIQQ